MFENVDLCESHAMFMCVIVCMDGIEFCLYGMMLTFVMSSNLIENVRALTTCSCHFMLQEDGNVDLNNEFTILQYNANPSTSFSRRIRGTSM